MSFAQFLAIMKASRWSILLMILASAGVAYAFASSLPKEYTAKARVMLDLANFDPTQYSALKKGTEADYIGTQLRLIGDDAVTRQVVDKLGWANDPSVVAAWEQSTGGVGDVTGWAARRIASNMTARQFEDSAIVEIFYNAGSVETAKQIVSLLRNAYIDNSQRTRVAAAQRASAWNRTQAATALVTLQKAEARRVDFVRANGIAIDRSNGGLDMQAVSQLASKSTRPLPPPGPVQPSGVMLSLKRDLNALDARIAQLESLGPGNPETLAAMNQRDVMRAQLARETAFNQAGSNGTAEMLAENRRLVSEEYLKARLKVLDHASQYDELAQLDREIKLRTALYTAAAARVKNFDLIAAAPSGIRVLGDIIAEDEPSFPNIPLATGLAAGFGLGLGLAFALFGEMLRRRVRGAEDLRFYSQVPVLAVIAASSRPPRRRRRWHRAVRSRRLEPAE